MSDTDSTLAALLAPEVPLITDAAPPIITHQHKWDTYVTSGINTVLGCSTCGESMTRDTDGEVTPIFWQTAVDIGWGRDGEPLDLDEPLPRPRWWTRLADWWDPYRPGGETR